MSEQNGRIDKTVHTLLLDMNERLTIAEQTSKVADMQRTMLISASEKMSDRMERMNEKLHPLSDIAKSISRMESDLFEVETKVAKHESLLTEVKGGLRVVKWLWGGVAVVLGAVVLTLLKKLGGV